MNDKPKRDFCYGWAAAFVVAVALWISAIDFDSPSLFAAFSPCGETIETNLLSPDAERRVVVYTAGCGAAGSSSYGFSVLWANQEVEYAAPFNGLHTQYDEPIEVAWRGSDTLDVTVPGWVLTDGLTHLITSRVHGIEVIYNDSTTTVETE